MTNTEEFSVHQVGSFTRDGLSTQQIFVGERMLGWSEYSVEHGAYYGRAAADPYVRLEGMSATTREIGRRLLRLAPVVRSYPCPGKWHLGEAFPSQLGEDGRRITWVSVSVTGEIVPNANSGRVYYKILWQDQEFAAHADDLTFDED